MAKDATAKNDVQALHAPRRAPLRRRPRPRPHRLLDALDKWATGGAAPEELTASFAAGGARKVCAYPKKAVYKGTGDGKSPDQFECR